VENWGKGVKIRSYTLAFKIQCTPSVPICKQPFIREKRCLHIGTEEVDGSWYDNDNFCQRSRSEILKYSHSDLLIMLNYLEINNRCYDDDHDQGVDDN